jgi:hypothetical protein
VNKSVRDVNIIYEENDRMNNNIYFMKDHPIIFSYYYKEQYEWNERKR